MERGESPSVSRGTGLLVDRARSLENSETWAQSTPAVPPPPRPAPLCPRLLGEPRGGCPVLVNRWGD